MGKIVVSCFYWIVEFLTPSKICFTYDGPYKPRKSNRKKHTQGLKLKFIKEVPWQFARRPQRAIRRIGASDPPLYSCKKLERSLKGRTDNFFCFSLMPLDHEKKRCRAKAKAKANKKAIRTSFLWLRCVLLVWPIFLFPSLAIFLFHQWPGSWLSSVPAFAGSRTQLVVTQSGSDPAARHGSVPRTDAV